MASFLDQVNSQQKNKPEAVSAAEERETVEKGGVPRGIRSTEHETYVDRQYFFKKLFAIVGSIVGAIIVIVGIIIAVHQARLVEIKDFSGRSIVEMRKWAAEYNMILDEKQIYDSTVPSDTIISQDIQKGEKRSPKTSISVVVSLGADPGQHIDVPDLSSMTAAEIRSWADKNQIVAVKIVEENSDTVPKGGVLRYEFASVSVTPDTFKRSDSITVYVSKGPAQVATVKVQTLVGSTRATVEKWASDNKLTLIVKEVISDKYAKDIVASQSVEAGTVIRQGETVTIEVSVGVGVTVPDYSKYARTDAENVDPSIRIIFRNIYSNKVAYGKLISQSVGAGKKIIAGETTIELTYSLGRPYIDDLAGRKENELPELFSQYSFGGANITYTTVYVDSSAKKGTVVSASKSNEYIDVNEKIIVSVSKGNLSDDTPSGEDIMVPDFSLIPKRDATTAAGNLTVIIKEVYSDTVAYGKFVSQSVKAGDNVKSSQGVTVTYSKGKPYIPTLIGKSENELPRMIDEFNADGSNLNLYTFYVDSSKEKGTVVRVAIGGRETTGGEYVSVNDTLVVWISRGNVTDPDPVDEYVIVPDFSQYTADTAASAISGVTVNVREVYSDSVFYGTVVSQTVPVGARIQKGTSITVTYSLGRPFMPELKGKMENELPELFSQFNRNGASLSYRTEYVDSAEPKGTVVEASRSSEYVSLEEVIVIKVSRGNG